MEAEKQNSFEDSAIESDIKKAIDLYIRSSEMKNSISSSDPDFSHIVEIATDAKKVRDEAVNTLNKAIKSLKDRGISENEAIDFIKQIDRNKIIPEGHMSHAINQDISLNR